MMKLAGVLLQKWRKKHNLSQQKAAEQTGLSQAAWSDYEQSLKDPSVTTAIRIREATGVPLSAWAKPAPKKAA